MSKKGSDATGVIILAKSSHTSTQANARGTSTHWNDPEDKVDRVPCQPCPWSLDHIHYLPCQRTKLYLGIIRVTMTTITTMHSSCNTVVFREFIAYNVKYYNILIVIVLNNVTDIDVNL